MSEPDARTKLAAAGVQFLEALAAVLAAERHAIPPELATRGAAALRTILAALDGADGPASLPTDTSPKR